MRYIIVCPIYNAKSAGIAVLQELQKLLVKAGKDAIIPNFNINAPYAIQDDDIVVYPEIISGNPLNAKRVVRYILNVPGKLGGTAEYDSSEILVAYTKELSIYSNGVYLTIPIIEDFFTNRGLERDIDCCWVGKGQNTNHPITKDCIQVTYQWPSKRRQLAELFNRTRVCYSYDDFTHICLEALLCGCTVKLIKNNEINEIVGSDLSFYLNKEEFQRQLDQFIQMTWFPEIDLGHEAAAYIESVISSKNQAIPLGMSMSDALGLAMKHHMAGELDHAEDIYQQIASIEPDNFAAIHMLGVVYFQRNDLVQAELLLRQAIVLCAEIPEVHYNLGCTLKQSGNYEDARLCFLKSLSLNPLFEKARLRLDELNKFTE